MYTPKSEDKFSFGLWTDFSRGRELFGTEVGPQKKPAGPVHLLAEAGASSVNLKENDLTPVNATPSVAVSIRMDFRIALEDTGLEVLMATTILIGDSVFKNGACASSMIIQRSSRCRHRSLPVTDRFNSILRNPNRKNPLRLRPIPLTACPSGEAALQMKCPTNWPSTCCWVRGDFYVLPWH